MLRIYFHIFDLMMNIKQKIKKLIDIQKQNKSILLTKIKLQIKTSIQEKKEKNCKLVNQNSKSLLANNYCKCKWILFSSKNIEWLNRENKNKIR